MQLTFNGHVFVDGRTAFRRARDAGEAVSGFFRRTPTGIQLFGLDETRIGGVNRHRVVYRSSRLDDGRLWHQAAAPEAIGGLDYPSLRCYDEAVTALRAVHPTQ